MDNQAMEKIESLMKYIPFIDFVLNFDKTKYIKFINIRNWIISKKKYPLKALNQIEKSITTQYKNLLLQHDVEIPEEIAKIFAPMNFKQFVNLCSDEEEENEVSQNAAKTNNKTTMETKQDPKKVMYESDDDLEIISVDYMEKPNATKELNKKDEIKNIKRKKHPTKIKPTEVTKKNTELDEVSLDILKKIDELVEYDIKEKNVIHEPINYTYQEKDFENNYEEHEKLHDELNLKQEQVDNIFQRRASSNVETDLFKRRKDFQNNSKVEDKHTQDKVDEVEVQSLDCINSESSKHFSQRPIEIISLDSGSDTEDDDNQPCTSKQAALREAEKSAKTKTSVLKKSNEKEIISKTNLNKQTPELEDSMDLLFADIDVVLDEADKNNNNIEASKTPHQTNKERTEINKENLLTTTTKELADNDNTNSIQNEKDISKIDVDVNVLSSALEFLKQKSCNGITSPISIASQTKPAETPPPAPPPINVNMTPTCRPLHPSNVCYTSHTRNVQHAPQYLTSSQFPPNNNISNTAPSIPVPLPKPNDPRIRKQLDQIKNSAVMNILNPGMAASIMQYCQSQQYQQAQQHTSVKPPGYAKSATSTSSSKTTSTYNYGEHKRRQEEKRLEEEKLREEHKAKLIIQHRLLEEEKERKIKADIEKRKLEEEMRSKLLSTLKPCEDILTTVWQKTKNILNNNPAVNAKANTSKEQISTQAKKINNEMTKDQTKTSANDETCVSQKKKSKPKPKSKCKKSYKNNKNKESNQNKSDRRLNRIQNELKCTIIGFDNLNDYIPNANMETSNNTNAQESHKKDTTNLTSKPIGLKRRSSIHALTAISKQLKQTESSEIEMSQKSSYGINSTETSGSKRRLNDISYDSTSSQKTTWSSPKRRRTTTDEIIKPTKRSNSLRILDDDGDDEISSSVNVNSTDNEQIPMISQQNLTKKNPIIKLRRISDSTIKKHARKPQETDDLSNKLKKKFEKPAAVDRFTNTKPVMKTKRNNDCQMTERNTSFCTLCNSKPQNLTKHYIGRHKTESYVSRLDWSELDELTVNTPIAKLLPKTKGYRCDRYEVVCPFCKETIKDTFMDLYQHYSSHTGEYAFQCGYCYLIKPYRADIISHRLNSKTCRDANIKVLYRYSANAQCIYLHYCVICNFVQINEANVLKHLREHHERSQNIPSNVAKCILVAISDGPEVNESIKPPTPSPTPSPVEQVIANETLANVQHNVGEDATLNFKVDDDDIPVGNEPCLDDEEYSVEDQLKQLHEEPTSTTNCVTACNIYQTQISMTVIPCMDKEPDKRQEKDQLEQLSKEPSIATGNIPMTVIHGTGIEPERVSVHKPLPIKNEFMDVEEKFRLSTITPNDNKDLANTPNPFITYQQYRNYPSNVNYLGLYKCMIDDCYYSTDNADEFCQHLNEHNASEENLQLTQPLQCPYCIIPMDMIMDPRQLIEHVRTHHSHMIYQCSLCCYRSCDASNVNVHQHIHHSSVINTYKIYKCSEMSEQSSNSCLMVKPSLEELLDKNITKNISCNFCKTMFCHTQFLINHLINVHKIQYCQDLEFYSCLYCQHTLPVKENLRHHLAIKHPNEQPRIYDNNVQNNTEDIKSPLNIIELTETVEYVIPTPTNNNFSINQLDEENQDTADIKPNLDQLMEMNEETLRVRLRKLTKHTGIPPENLYRCPETKCGGFFSNYSLWLRHMKTRHQCIECQCPHCSVIDSLQQLELHFEQHRRHTFICFHCSTTFAKDLLAREHAANNHNDLGEMRTEYIRFNLSYCYSIILKTDLYQERQIFLAELLKLIDERLKELEGNESKTLKQQWPVHDNAFWIDDYLARLQNRKVLRNCIITDCGFHTANTEYLYEHMRSTHVIEKTTFNCSTCDYQLKDCVNLEDIINHVKIHNSSLCICTACVSHTTSNRYKMSLHIEQQHTARDVPVVRVFKNNHELFIEIYIVFADNCLTFSTIKNCFCCPERNMNPDRFALHLKHYHKFTLIYYCEKCKSNLKFQSLDEVKTHFQQEHSTEKLKIRCKLLAHYDLRLLSLNDLQVEILTDQQQQLAKTSLVEIKNEPLDVAEEDDDDVILLEDNDIVIENALKEAKQQEPKGTPKIKLAPLVELIQPTTTKTTTCHFVNNINTSLTNISTNYQQSPVSSNILQNTFVPQQSTGKRIQVPLYGSGNNVSSSSNQFINLNTLPTTTTVYVPYRNNIHPPPPNTNLHIANPPTATAYTQLVTNNNNHNFPINEQNNYLPTSASVNNATNANLSNSRILITPQTFNGIPVAQSQHSINLPNYNVLLPHTSTTPTIVNNAR